MEFIETSEEACSVGLRRIKSHYYTGPLDLLPLDENIVESKLLAKKIREQLLSEVDFVNRLSEKLAE